MVQEKKRKIDFQDGRHGGHIGFPIETISAISDLQVTLMVPTEFKVNWPSDLGEESKIDGGHLRFPIGKILAVFDLHFTPMLLAEFQVNGPFGSGGEA